jgi:hypothetical protein
VTAVQSVEPATAKNRHVNDLWRGRMFVKTVATIARFSLIVLPVAVLATASCGGGGNGGTAGNTGTAGSSGGTGGAAGTGGTGVASCITVSPTAADSTIMDWENLAPGATKSSFLGYLPGTYGGGTFEYPGPAMGSPCDPSIHLCPNFDGKNWHITGTVHDYSGFGIYFTEGSVWDVSMFTGLSFDISGTFTMAANIDAGGAPAAQVTLNVIDLPHEVDSAHTADHRSTCGTCVPMSGNEYDGSCVAPTKVITLTSTATPTMLHWLDISDGMRPPHYTGESPDPAKISHITWVLPWNGSASTPSAVDVVIDNLKYLTD